MKWSLGLMALPLLAALNGCAVVSVGAAAVNVATTATGIAWDVGKAGVEGTAAVGGWAYDKATAPSATPAPVQHAGLTAAPTTATAQVQTQPLQ
ncbi:MULTISPECIES: hypothetical protein [Silvimonas]|uniref:hypothetical protein n=1 Tax=Silvimonas TaxID=300264 RepID=UPI0024B36C74|nr:MULTISPECIES: hypothetical protein [Silvimonas]MDR3425981.1 hypothetical protein [Silvimonas sp.]